MKKSLIALFVAAFCFTSMAQVLIYDYSASVKRLNVALVKYNKAGAKLDSAKVASDKLYGYLVIDACKECVAAGSTEYMEKSTDYSGNDAVVYIVRASQKNVYFKDDTAEFYAAMWGAKTGYNTTSSAWINGDKFTDATGYLKFALPADEFLGFDSLQGYDVVNGGFGKVAKQSTKTVTTDDCLGDTTVVETCWMVKSLSGSTNSSAQYAGHCSEFLFDVCDLETPTFGQYAAIPGTFTLKLNNALTFEGKNFRNADFTEAEDTILLKNPAWVDWATL